MFRPGSGTRPELCHRPGAPEHSPARAGPERGNPSVQTAPGALPPGFGEGGLRLVKAARWVSSRWLGTSPETSVPVEPLLEREPNVRNVVRQ